jgi:hypothetical protein
LAERAELLLGPSARIVEDKAAGLAVKIILFEELSYSHSFYGLASGMGKEEG